MVLREENFISDKGGIGGIPSKIRGEGTCSLYQDQREPKMRLEPQYLIVLERERATWLLVLIISYITTGV